MRIDLFASDTIKLAGRQLSRRFELRRLEDLRRVHGDPQPSVIIGTARELASLSPKSIDHLREVGVRIIVTEAVPGTPMPRFERELILCTLPHLDEREEWRILSAFINNAIDLLTLHNQLKRTQQDLEEIIQIGVLLSSEKDTNKLLELILTKTREITNCDAGSLYLVEEKDNKRQLMFKMAQNDSVPLNLKEFPMPLSNQSLIGHTLLSGEPLVIDNAYEIDSEKPYSHARWVDKKNNYRTITILTVPLKNLKGDVLGGLQLINRKRDFNIRLVDPLTAMVVVQPFDDHAIKLVSSLASLAAVTLEKNRLYESIKELFDGFVNAAVKAIESRDPTTSGHSERVAIITEGLANEVNKASSGPFAKVHFSEEQLLELRYAALLHDFGKVGVREHVLVKAEKLYPGEKALLEMRVKLIRACLRAESWKRQLDYAMQNGLEALNRHEKVFLEETGARISQLENDLSIVMEANIPKLLPEGHFDQLADIADRLYATFDDEPLKIIDEKEAKILSIPKGSLTEEERLEIESHVEHTNTFLKRIKWTDNLRGIPEIAYKHHEKLNGKGYPRKLTEANLPIQARMMTICDIFDALTASDRPYKKAVPFDKALQILEFERKANQLDPDLLDLFVETKVFNLLLKQNTEETSH